MEFEVKIPDFNFPCLSCLQQAVVIVGKVSSLESRTMINHISVTL